ncbi:tRNA glutamyl-Q(34) synthetase GluQRS [Dermatobacter hominis]|uniref:tRNA glutamyl-Q(34) synthetase GluQRS n=1 Tax=Dermatobacter hominis TaxID=2884263 RepID=UPI001D11C34A|nr:tRNA glutamyl-Q(34) synthetase GluQRS [Dermatobacter hominis]UDY34093.1 tRNA glutamyl-Q(34) synthetase GluQRS [Dermatobacter hominis]
MPTGRFAPSPSAPLHLGNLRTALLAWAAARSEGGRFLVRVEDLTTSPGDPRAAEVAEAQLADLAALGLDHDGAVVRQSERHDRYAAALADLGSAGLTYPCFCTRREIREASVAPHGPDVEGAYPGTCRSLTDDERREREASGRPPALRLRAGGATVTVEDELLGARTAIVDDLVLRRADGAVAYNLAVVVDDADQGVDRVVRGDDLWDTTPRQVLLQRLLGLPTPRYLHVPLVLGPSGERLAKRDGAVTLADRLALGEDVASVVGRLAWSAGLADDGERLTAADVAARFDVARLVRTPWVLTGTS